MFGALDVNCIIQLPLEYWNIFTAHHMIKNKMRFMFWRVCETSAVLVFWCFLATLINFGESYVSNVMVWLSYVYYMCLMSVFIRLCVNLSLLTGQFSVCHIISVRAWDIYNLETWTRFLQQRNWARCNASVLWLSLSGVSDGVRRPAAHLPDVLLQSPVHLCA